MNVTQKQLNQMIRRAINAYYQNEYANQIIFIKMRLYKKHYKKDSLGKVTASIRRIAKRMNLELVNKPYMRWPDIWFSFKGKRKLERPFRKAVKLAISKYKV